MQTKFSLSGNQLIKNDNFLFDLSSIAKGYAVDQISKILDKNKHNNYLIDIGGELIVKGDKQAMARATTKSWGSIAGVKLGLFALPAPDRRFLGKGEVRVDCCISRPRGATSAWWASQYGRPPCLACASPPPRLSATLANAG